MVSPTADRIVVVYTAICGRNGDQLPGPVPFAVRERGFRFVCFTDRREQAGGGWETRTPFWSDSQGRRLARKHKILCHELFPSATHTIWLDGSIRPQVSLSSLLDHVAEGRGLGVFPHRDRSCVYDELRACLRLKKDDPSVMTRQVERYAQLGMPKRYGLAETGVLVRRHGRDVFKYMDCWWREVSEGSVRDQLSFSYVSWQLEMKPTWLTGTVYRNSWFTFRPHR